MENINWTQQGWQCPVCKAVMSPTTSVCVNCRGVSHEVTINSIPSIQPDLDQYIDWRSPSDYPWSMSIDSNNNEAHAEAHIKEENK